MNERPETQRRMAAARHIDRFVVVVVVAAIASIWTAAASSSAGRVVGATRDSGASAADTVRIAAAGDIACPSRPYTDSSPDDCQYDDTSDLVVGKGFARILALGDDQYDVGAYQAYLTFYDRWWGRVQARTDPVPGNHEYHQDPDATPKGYFRYFGDRVKGPDGLGYYSFDVPTGCTPGSGVCWHVIAISSELCFASGGCGSGIDPASPGPGNRMHEWLKQDLLAHPDSTYPCTLAYWHHPLFSFSTGSGASPAVRPLWRLLYRAGTDVVLNGHSHNYQRWRPMTPAGLPDRKGGIREFVVGTGGASKYPLSSTRPNNVVAAQDRSFGVLVLTLHADGYSWAWRTAAGQTSYRDTHRVPVACR